MALTKVTGQVIKNTTDVTVGVLTVTNTLAVGGTVSIGGTLTYEDVTNVDAVGLVTARNGIVVGSGITLSKDGDIFATGVTTSTTFSGNFSGGTVSGTTGTFSSDVSIADKIVHTGDTNTLIRFPAAGTIRFDTDGNERARIDSSGRLLVATTSASAANSSADDLVVGNTSQGNNGMSIVTNNANIGGIYFADQDATVQGGVRYQHGSDLAQFYAGGSVVLNLKNKGVGINETSPAADALTIRGGDTDDTPKLILKRATDGIQSDGEIIGKLQFMSNENNVDSGNYQPRAEIHGVTVSTSGAAKMDFYTVPNSTTTPVKAMTLNQIGQMLLMSNTGYNASSSLLSLATDASSGANMLSDSSAIYNHTNPAFVHVQNMYNTGDGQEAGIILHSKSSFGGAWAIYGKRTTSSFKSDLIFRGRSGQNASAESLRITSDGLLRAGSTSNTDTAIRLALHNSGGTGSQVQFTGSGTGETSGDGCRVGYNGSGAQLWNFEDNYTRFATNNTERYRIHNNGRQSWNNTTFPYGETFHFYNGLSGRASMSIFHGTDADEPGLIMRHGRAGANNGAYTGKYIQFRSSDGNERGSVTGNNSATAYNTSSDYRLKENEVTISDAISKVKQLKPYTFNFKVTPDQKVDGFFAHEAQEVIPYAVVGEKDAEDMQQIDYGKLTPLLTAALQEAITEIESLKAEVAALKSS